MHGHTLYVSMVASCVGLQRGGHVHVHVSETFDEKWRPNYTPEVQIYVWRIDKKEIRHIR